MLIDLPNRSKIFQPEEMVVYEYVEKHALINVPLIRRCDKSSTSLATAYDGNPVYEDKVYHTIHTFRLK